MKKYVKLFEEFLNEDVLSDLNLDTDKKEDSDKEEISKDGEKDVKKDDGDEDIFKKEKEKEKKRHEKEENKHQKFVDGKLQNIQTLLKDYPEVNADLGKEIVDAVESQDRVKIHNMFNKLTVLAIEYQENGNMDVINHIAQLKNQLDDLDMSYTDDKKM